MKKVHYILFVIFFASTACESELDQTPEFTNSVETAVQNLDDLENLLLGTYARLRGTGYHTRNYSELPDMMGDDLVENPESLTNFSANTNWEVVANDATVNASWAALYNLILRTNLVLENADRADPTASPRRNRILAQAYALRAMGHFDLLRYFGQSYDRNSTELGVSNVLTSELNKPARNTVQENYDQIYSDIDMAHSLYANIDQPVNPFGVRRFMDEWGAYALRARVSLYAKDYADAIASANQVINNSGIMLASGVDFNAVFKNDDESKEVVFSVAYDNSGQGRVGSNVFFFSPLPAGRAAFVASDAYLALFNAPTDDVRYTTYLNTTLRPGLHVVEKYRGRNGAVDGVVNFKALRLGEMYLIRAEAKANSNNATAIDDLNTLRASRITGYTNENLSGNALSNAIKDERRKELFMEGHRWFDVKRYGEGITRGADCLPPATSCSLSAGSTQFVWPIPDAEMNANPNMVQNPGY